jgi:hypothetical protein
MNQNLVLRIQGVFELSSLLFFFTGYYTEILWLMFLGGAMLIIDNLMTIIFRLINPVYPLLLAVLLSLFFTPWYIGVFMACAVFTLFGIPNSFMKIWDPAMVLIRAQEKTDKLH